MRDLANVPSKLETRCGLDRKNTDTPHAPHAVCRYVYYMYVWNTHTRTALALECRSSVARVSLECRSSVARVSLKCRERKVAGAISLPHPHPAHEMSHSAPDTAQRSSPPTHHFTSH
jgi:hypothetical protein